MNDPQDRAEVAPPVTPATASTPPSPRPRRRGWAPIALVSALAVAVGLSEIWVGADLIGVRNGTASLPSLSTPHVKQPGVLQPRTVEPGIVSPGRGFNPGALLPGGLFPGTLTPGIGGSTQTGSLDLATVTAAVTPALVNINTVVAGGAAAGSGIILTSDGEVLTNHHVVQGSTAITVTIQGRSGTYRATLLGQNASQDVALLRIQGVSGLPTARLGDSSSVGVGQEVAAIGNAYGRGGTPPSTQGTVTALNQSITAGTDSGGSENLSGLIESNAVIAPGDSGGALVNSAGQVIGMITAGQTTGHRSASAIGYAVPINTAMSVVSQVRGGDFSGGTTNGVTGFLGVAVRDVTAANPAPGVNVSSGALIKSVVPGSGAEAAGIPAGSVIVSVAGQPVTDASSLGTVLRAHRPGDRVRVSYVDAAGTHTVAATLGSGPIA